MIKINKSQMRSARNFFDGQNGFANISTSKFFSDPEMTPEGFLLVDTILGRQCILPYVYVGPDGQEITRHEFLGPDILSEQFRQSTEGAPFVLEHPQDQQGNFVDVTPENYQEFIKGTIIRPRHVNVSGETMLIGTLKVFDPEVIDLIVSKKLSEVSQGYLCQVTDVPGTFNGKKYDSIQSDFFMNHLALVNEGRAGDSVKILFNSRSKKEVLEFVKNSKDKKNKIGGSKMKPNNNESAPNSPASNESEELENGVTETETRQNAGMPGQPDPMKMQQQNMPENGGMNPMMQMLQLLMQMMGGGMMQNGGMNPQGQFMPFNTGIGGQPPFVPQGMQNSHSYIPQYNLQPQPQYNQQFNNAQTVGLLNDSKKINDLVVGGIRESQEALIKSSAIYGNSASSEFTKHNTVEDFKKQALKDSKIVDDALIDKMNSAQVSAYFDVATSVAKSHINAPSVSSEQLAFEEDEFI